jgi:bacteriorhodopsin
VLTPPSAADIRRGVCLSNIWWIVLAVVWVAIAFWPARVAGRKGHSFAGYFIFSLFLLPAAVIVAYLVPVRARVQLI